MDGLATCRKAAGLTQAALAAILGVSQAAVGIRRKIAECAQAPRDRGSAELHDR